MRRKSLLGCGLVHKGANELLILHHLQTAHSTELEDKHRLTAVANYGQLDANVCRLNGHIRYLLGEVLVGGRLEKRKRLLVHLFTLRRVGVIVSAPCDWLNAHSRLYKVEDRLDVECHLLVAVLGCVGLSLQRLGHYEGVRLVERRVAVDDS